jgi:hypothetical protein
VLVLSASMMNADRAQSLVPGVLIPQLIFVGVPGTGCVAQWLSYFTITHWSDGGAAHREIPFTGGNGFGAGSSSAGACSGDGAVASSASGSREPALTSALERV